MRPLPAGTRTHGIRTSPPTRSSSPSLPPSEEASWEWLWPRSKAGPKYTKRFDVQTCYTLIRTTHKAFTEYVFTKFIPFQTADIWKRLLVEHIEESVISLLIRWTRCPWLQLTLSWHKNKMREKLMKGELQPTKLSLHFVDWVKFDYLSCVPV